MYAAPNVHIPFNIVSHQRQKSKILIFQTATLIKPVNAHVEFEAPGGKVTLLKMTQSYLLIFLPFFSGPKVKTLEKHL